MHLGECQFNYLAKQAFCTKNVVKSTVFIFLQINPHRFTERLIN